MFVSSIILAVLVPGSRTFATARSQSTGITTRVSVASDGTQGNDLSGFFQHAADKVPITPDGRYVAFASKASNLVSNDTNSAIDVFVHDRLTGITERVSISSMGDQGNADSHQPSISADGRFVAFASWARNLVISSTSGLNIFVHDRLNRQTVWVSFAWDGSMANGDSDSPVISADGRYVAFFSTSSNLVNPSRPYSQDVYVHDLWTRRTEIVSVSTEGNWGNSASSLPAISSDGRYIAFQSRASNLVDGDTNNATDVFVRDRVTGVTERVSVASEGTQGNGDSESPSISADGRFVAFRSRASNLVSGDTNNAWDVFVHDRQTHQTLRVSIASDGTQANDSSTWVSLSPDGRYVAFGSLASNLVSDDTNGYQDVFIHDIVTGQTIRVSTASNGVEGNNTSFLPSTSIGARYVAFVSTASNLVPGDTNGTDDVFVHDQRSGALTLDLPLAYQANGLSFGQAFQRCTTALFDHHYPFEKGANGDQNLLPYTGVPISDTLGTQCQFGVNCYDGHEGYDFDDRSGCGTVALAAADGEIISSESGCGKEYGCQVVITHTAGYSTLYGHLRNDASLRTSGTVAQGDVIGTIGQTGGAIGTHLHFGVYHNGQVVDPSGWWTMAPDPWEVRSEAKSVYLWKGRIQTRGTINGPSGGTVTSPSGGAIISAPAGAYTGTLIFDFAEIPVAEPSAKLKSAGHSFSLYATDLSGNPVTTFDQPLTITVTFTLTDLMGIESGTLALYTWDNAASSWQPLSTSIDWVSGTATAQTNHLSYFALLGERMYTIYLPVVLR
jgi:murein DD-endopeptidase MepM/ murein hydrolase activator NlpD